MEETDVYKAYIRSPAPSMKHSTYFETYEALLTPYRGKPVTMIEIGILGGGSLFMWRDFLGPEARIIGMDLNPGAKKWEAEGFEIYIGSQSDPDFWREVMAEIGPVDIVLDDGGHTFEQQIVTTEALLDHINDGGVLIVEDTHTSYMAGFGARRWSFLSYVKNRIDGINRRYRRLNQKRAERRIWSVQVFESIVAFHINHTASERLSEPTENGVQGEPPEDFRFHDNGLFGTRGHILDQMPWLKKLPKHEKIARAIGKAQTYFQSIARTRRFFK